MWPYPKKSTLAPTQTCRLTRNSTIPPLTSCTGTWPRVRRKRQVSGSCWTSIESLWRSWPRQRQPSRRTISQRRRSERECSGAIQGISTSVVLRNFRCILLNMTTTKRTWSKFLKSQQSTMIGLEVLKILITLQTSPWCQSRNSEKVTWNL